MLQTTLGTGGVSSAKVEINQPIYALIFAGTFPSTGAGVKATTLADWVTAANQAKMTVTRQTKHGQKMVTPSEMNFLDALEIANVDNQHGWIDLVDNGATITVNAIFPIGLVNAVPTNRNQHLT